jgi:predicted RNase H-like HicB family nuclease
MSEKRYPIVIERTATGFSAYSPDVPVCAAAGDTGEKARQISGVRWRHISN